MSDIKDMITAREYAEKYEKTQRHICRCCREGLLKTAEKKGVWLINKNEKLPVTRNRNKKNINKEDNEIVKKIYEESGLSKEEFYKKIEISRTNLYYILTNKKTVTEQIKKKIIDTFGLEQDIFNK